MYKLEDVIHEIGRFWVLRVKTGYNVYEIRGCASYRCGQFGKGEVYLQRAIEYANKRAAS